MERVLEPIHQRKAAYRMDENVWATGAALALLSKRC